MEWQIHNSSSLQTVIFDIGFRIIPVFQVFERYHLSANIRTPNNNTAQSWVVQHFYLQEEEEKKQLQLELLQIMWNSEWYNKWLLNISEYLVRQNEFDHGEAGQICKKRSSAVANCKYFHNKIMNEHKISLLLRKSKKKKRQTNIKHDHEIEQSFPNCVLIATDFQSPSCSTNMAVRHRLK